METRHRNLASAAALIGALAIISSGCGEAPQADAAEPGFAKPQAMLAPEAGVDCSDLTDPTKNCPPSGAHRNSALNRGHDYACEECHAVAGRLAFKPGGLAFGAGWNATRPRPTFDYAAKTCTNVACHTVPAGTFSYYFIGGDGEAVLNTVTYGGGAPRPTPSWYVTGGAACAACHDDPPRSGSTGSNVWHSGFHANQGPTGAANQCQFCHPDASSPGNGVGDTITNATLHANGVVNVAATFRSSCFSCH